MMMRKMFCRSGATKNPVNLPKEKILDQMAEARPLPMGRQEFEEWSDRIISGALVSADVISQKYALANLLLHLGPTESHKPDAFFIHSLRKFAVNQVADEIRKELYAAKKAEGGGGGEVVDVAAAVPPTPTQASPLSHAQAND